MSREETPRGVSDDQEPLVTARPLTSTTLPLSLTGSGNQTPLQRAEQLSSADHTALFQSIQRKLPSLLGDAQPAPASDAPSPFPFRLPPDLQDNNGLNMTVVRPPRRGTLEPPARPEQDRRPLTPIQSIEADPSTSLSDVQRSALAPIMGSGIPDVRLHTGEAAGATATSIGADAFTKGRDIFFAPDRFDPFSASGKALLAHELTHVRQQMNGTPIQRTENDSTEQEALAVERLVLGASAGGAGASLMVNNFELNYVGSDGARLTSQERARLDTISIRALHRCEQILGPTLDAAPFRELPEIHTNVRLNLATLSDDQAIEAWAFAMAEAIRGSMGA